MADKIKNFPLNGIKDGDALLKKVQEFLKARNLQDVLMNPKVPRKEWVAANAKDGKVTVVLEGKIEPGSKKGPLRLVAKASNGASSVMAVADISTVKKWQSADAKQMDGILKNMFG
jgi:hypothetical protein